MTATTGERAEVEAARDRVLAAMERRGYPIRGRVHVEMRPGLRAVATTVPAADGYAILVGPQAFERGSLDALLAHELSHVHRMDAKHASHNDDAITAAYDALPPRATEHEYQRAFLHHAINIVEDLYADGIAFEVMEEVGAIRDSSVGDLLDGFLTDEPFDIADEREHRWDVTHDMVNNARTIALLKRYGTPLDVARAEATQARLLAKIPKDIAAHAPWFQALFDGFTEETDDARFTAMLVDYTLRFADVADGLTPTRS